MAKSYLLETLPPRWCMLSDDGCHQCFREGKRTDLYRDKKDAIAEAWHIYKEDFSLEDLEDIAWMQQERDAAREICAREAESQEIDRDTFQLLAKYAIETLGARTVGDAMGISRSQVELWAKGRSLPMPTARRSVVRYLKRKLTSDKELEIDTPNNLDGKWWEGDGDTPVSKVLVRQWMSSVQTLQKRMTKVESKCDELIEQGTRQLSSHGDGVVESAKAIKRIVKGEADDS